MMEFTFEPTAWELALENLRPGDLFPAARLLALLEEADEPEVEEALQALEQKGITLDIGDLPRFSPSGEIAARLRQEQQMVESGDLLQALDENDPLRLYLQELAATPVCGDPRLLAEQYLQGDEAAAEKLTGCMLSCVVEEAKKTVGRGMLLLDLIQEGSLGLWQGILCYAGGDVQAHCLWWIRQYIAKAVTLLSRAGGVGQKLRQSMEDYRDVDQRLLSELGRNPTLEEIAQQLHMPPQEAEMVEAMVAAARNMHRVKAAAQPEQPDAEADQAVENTAYFQSRQRILEMLSTLDDRQAKLLTLRFGLEGGLPLSTEETARKMNMTQAEVVAEEAAALAKLRQEN